MSAFTWTDERVERLRRLRADGLSLLAIAFEIGAPSRSTVAGKVARLGLKLERPSAPAPVEPLPEPEAVAIEMPPVDVRIVEVGSGVLFLNRKPLQCAMALPGWDDVSIFEKRCCGRPVVMRSAGNGSSIPTSWCVDCSKLVYVPSRFKDFKDKQLGIRELMK